MVADNMHILVEKSKEISRLYQQLLIKLPNEFKIYYQYEFLFSKTGLILK